MGASKANLTNPTEAPQPAVDPVEHGESVDSNLPYDQSEDALMEFAHAQLSQHQGSRGWSVSQQFTLKRMLLVGPLAAIFLSLPAAKWSPAAELHILLLVATGYAFVMITCMLPVSLCGALLHCAVFSGNRAISFRVAFRTIWYMSRVALACLAYLVYSYGISMING